MEQLVSYIYRMDNATRSFKIPQIHMLEAVSFRKYVLLADQIILHDNSRREVSADESVVLTDFMIILN